MERFKVTSALTLASAVLIALPLVGTSQEKKKDQERSNAKGQQITLKIEGVECANCARVMTSSLQEAQLKPVGAIKPNTTGPTQIVAACPNECDLGAAAVKVKQAQTPHREKVPPTISLVLFADLNAESASAALAACQKIEGIDGRACQANATTGEIDLRINGEKEVTVTQIMVAMKEAGVEVRTTSPKAATLPRTGS